MNLPIPDEIPLILLSIIMASKTELTIDKLLEAYNAKTAHRGDLLIKKGELVFMLHNLQEKGWLASEDEESRIVIVPDPTTYSLTEKGKKTMFMLQLLEAQFVDGKLR
jgi:DNA-binding PadR family transcriptional regulator